MRPEVINETNMSDAKKEAVRSFCMRSSFTDHEYGFKTDNGKSRTVKKFHVTSEKIEAAGEYAPFPWMSGDDDAAYIAVEDQDGNMIGLQHCSPSLISEWAFAAVIKEADKYWAFPFSKEPGGDSEITAERVLSGEVRPFRIYGQAEECSEENAPIEDMCPFDGEIYYTQGDRPIITAMPWTGSLTFDENNNSVNPDYRAQAEAAVAAMMVMAAAESEMMRLKDLASEIGVSIGDVEAGLSSEYAAAMEAAGKDVSDGDEAAIRHFLSENYSAENVLNIAGYEASSPAP